MTLCSAGCRDLTPVMCRSPSGVVRTLAPQALRKAARSEISGSRAAFLMTVSPSAREAAIMMFSVAPTLGKGSGMLAPRRRSFTVQLR